METEPPGDSKNKCLHISHLYSESSSYEEPEHTSYLFIYLLKIASCNALVCVYQKYTQGYLEMNSYHTELPHEDSLDDYY